MTAAIKPPAIAQAILRLCLPRDQGGLSILGDLAFDFARMARTSPVRARFWYYREAVTIGMPYAVIRIRSFTKPNRRPTLAGPRARLSATDGSWNMTLGNIGKDLRYAARSLRRSPGFALVTIGTLGLAIGANAAIFSVVDTVLLDPFPFANADRLIRVAATAPGSDLPDEFGISAEFYVQYREEADLLEDIATYTAFTSTLRTSDRVERIFMGGGTPSLFSTLGATPIMGRLPVEEDESSVVVISHNLWTTWFGSDPEVIGRAYDIAGSSRTVIGIMGPDFWFPDQQPLLWIPQVIRSDQIVPGRFGIRAVARIAPDTDLEQVVNQLSTVAQRIPDRFGGSANYNRIIQQHRPVVRPLKDELLGPLSRALWVILGAVGVVLLIACANVANLFLVRFDGRQRELAVRRAMGATRTRLIATQLSEAFVVAMGAGIVALLLMSIGVTALISAAPANVPRLHEVGISLSTLSFTFALCLGAALLCGLIPSIRASIPSMHRLRDGGRGSTRRNRWGRDALVIGQTALALVLLIGSGLLVKSFWKLSHVDPGYNTENIFTFQIAPEGDNLFDGPSYAQFHTSFMERVAGLPGVESVGIVENVPLNEGLRQGRFRTEETVNDTDLGPLISFTYSAGDYFRTMEIDLLRGRTFTEADHTSNFGNAILSQSAAELLFPGEDPTGRRFKAENDTTWTTAVGVVEDIMQYGFREGSDPIIYYPIVGPTPTSWVMSSPGYVVKTGRADVIAPEIRALVREVAPTAPMYRMFTMEGLAADSMSQLSFTMLTLGIASALALILGAIGLYGVLSYVVSERTQEIGLRMALGAQASWVQRMVVAQGARVAALGVLIGAAAALVTTRFLGGLLYGVQTVDAKTFFGMSLAMIMVALLASYLPARRASRTDPIHSLRGD